jgi:DNA-binding transcriptional LysR family regulator
VESGSFVAAADRLDMSNAMVSKHVMHVEKRLGVRVLNRSTRSLSLTEAGRVYYERCKTILDDLEQTEIELGSQNSAPRGALRVTAPSWLASRTMATFLADFRRRYPDVVVDMSFEDRYVDLVEEGFDLGLRAPSGPMQAGLIARPALSIPFLVAGSKDYLKRHGKPEVPEDIASHDCVTIGNMDTWKFKGRNTEVDVPLRVVLRFRSMSGVANAAAEGIGLAPLPLLTIEDPVFRQVLTPVLTDFPLAQVTLYLVYVSRKFVPLKIRTFIDAFVEFAAKSGHCGASQPKR